MIGTYKGYYRYNSAKIRKSFGLERTQFTIEITMFDGEFFEGSIHDDQESGGMAEPGIVKGRLHGGKISFEKLMPKSYYLMDDNTVKIDDGPHPTIYYSGKENKSTESFKGRWRILEKHTFFWGFINVNLINCSGTWEMQDSLRKLSDFCPSSSRREPVMP